jgi:hypothetical protein
MNPPADARSGWRKALAVPRHPWFCALAVVLILWGAKLGLVAAAGSDVPLSDQWDAEAAHLYLPHLQGELTLRAWVEPHNEHRIFFTRLLALGLLRVNGQWDPKLQLVVNALLAALTLGLLSALVLRQLDGWQPALAAVGLTALFVVPAGWENTLFAFQSQFFFLLLGTFFHLGGTMLAAPGSRWRWLAQLAGGAALFTMASGIASAAAVLGVLAVRLARQRRLDRDDRPLWIWNGVWVVVGVLLQTSHGGHAALRASSVTEYLHGLAWLLSWPTGWLGWAPLLVLPLIALLINTWRAPTPLRWFLLALGVWWLGQVLLIAYARGSGLLGSSRYLDLLVIGLAVGGLAWLDWIRTLRQRLVLAGVLMLATGWTVVVSRGLIRINHDVREGVVAAMRADEARWLPLVRQEVLRPGTGFGGGEPYVDFPYPNAERLAGLLREPALRRILPPSLRPSLPLVPDPAASHGFATIIHPASVPPQAAEVWGRASTAATEPAALVSREMRTRTGHVILYAAGTGGEVRLEMPSRTQPLTVTPETRWTEWIPATDGGPVRLVAQVPEGHQLWVSSPVEIGRGGWLARRVAASARRILFVGTALLGLSLLAIVIVGRPWRPWRPTAPLRPGMP